MGGARSNVRPRNSPSESFFRLTRADLATAAARERRWKRSRVEHVMARVAAIRGHRARFRGLEKVRLDTKRTAVVANLYVLAELLPAAA